MGRRGSGPCNGEMIYVLNGRERLLLRSDVPQPLEGAPHPLFISDERRLFLAYFAEDDDVSIVNDGAVSEPRLVEPNSVDDLVAVCVMEYYSMHAAPFDWESLAGHPLRDKGLNVCNVFELQASSWIADVAPPDKGLLNPRKFERWKHVMFVFNDSIIDIIGRNLSFQASRTGSREAVLREFFRSRSS